jgi:hypothetical protein
VTEEIHFAQMHFQDALRKINPQTDPGLREAVEGLNQLSRAFEQLENQVEAIRRAVQPPKR